MSKETPKEISRRTFMAFFTALLTAFGMPLAGPDKTAPSKRSRKSKNQSESEPVFQTPLKKWMEGDSDEVPKGFTYKSFELDYPKTQMDWLRETSGRPEGAEPWPNERIKCKGNWYRLPRSL